MAFLAGALPAGALLAASFPVGAIVRWWCSWSNDWGMALLLGARASCGAAEAGDGRISRTASEAR
eukprot:361423-Chlamydomonas_euryale.AAC.4